MTMTLEQVREVLEHLPGVKVLSSCRTGDFVELRLELPEDKPDPNSPPTLGIVVSDTLGIGERLA